MKTSLRMAGLIAALVGFLPAITLRAADTIVTPAMVGHWAGNAQIVVAWCHHPNLPVKVDIQADGTVTGTVGDARLTGGRFESNRGWLFRRLNWATDYIITGGLDGDIVAAEGINRARVKIPLNFSNDTFQGGVNTSGSGFEGFYGKAGEGTWMAARSLTLIHGQ